MNKVVNYFFDEDEQELVQMYKKLGTLAIVSFTLSILAIL